MEDNFNENGSNYSNDNYDVPENQKKGLGIASIILGGLSVLCCCCPGLGFLLAIIGGIFSIICLVKGTGSGRTLGIVGMVLNGIGLLMGLYMLISVAMTLNWENFTMENFNKLYEIDVDNDAEVYEWLQQFFRVDISRYYYD